MISKPWLHSTMRQQRHECNKSPQIWTTPQNIGRAKLQSCREAAHTCATGNTSRSTNYNFNFLTQDHWACPAGGYTKCKSIVNMQDSHLRDAQPMSKPQVHSIPELKNTQARLHRCMSKRLTLNLPTDLRQAVLWYAPCVQLIGWNTIDDVLLSMTASWIVHQFA